MSLDSRSRIILPHSYGSRQQIPDLIQAHYPPGSYTDCTQTQFKWHGENARANVHWTTRIDSVDQAPDYQINLYPSDLRNIVGEAGYRRIWSIPLGLDGEAAGCTEEIDPDDHGYKRVGIFLRKYTTDTRPLIPFHVDTNYCTGNVAINADDDYEGGNLLVCTGGKVSKARRGYRPSHPLETCI